MVAQANECEARMEKCPQTNEHEEILKLKAKTKGYPMTMERVWETNRGLVRFYHLLNLTYPQLSQHCQEANSNKRPSSLHDARWRETSQDWVEH